MSVDEIESAVADLSADELAQFAAWFDEFHAQAWDHQIESDFAAGRLDALLKEVDTEYDAGKAKPL
ncbi:MAG: hypothetical protein GXP24_05165 [Planctomycetes bacterium]|nr:hypothetical protein [Planctomycetota bacterium]